MLLVEGEDLVASLVSDTLVAHSYQFETASSVVKARPAIRDFDPVAALLDISLGKWPSGVDFAHALHMESPEIAIIFLTKHPRPRRPASQTPTCHRRCLELPQIGFTGAGSPRSNS